MSYGVVEQYVDGWMDGVLCGWVSGWVDVWFALLGGWIYGWMECCVHGCLGIRIVGRMDDSVIIAATINRPFNGFAD